MARQKSAISQAVGRNTRERNLTRKAWESRANETKLRGARHSTPVAEESQLLNWKVLSWEQATGVAFGLTSNRSGPVSDNPLLQRRALNKPHRSLRDRQSSG